MRVLGTSACARTMLLCAWYRGQCCNEAHVLSGNRIGKTKWRLCVCGATHQAQRKAHDGVAAAVQRQLHAPRLLLQQRCQASCAPSHQPSRVGLYVDCHYSMEHSASPGRSELTWQCALNHCPVKGEHEIYCHSLELHACAKQSRRVEHLCTGAGAGGNDACSAQQPVARRPSARSNITACVTAPGGALFSCLT